MTDSIEYLAILRCQTYNVWPERVVVEYRPFPVSYDSLTLPTRLLVRSYAQRTDPERYLYEETSLGPLIWDGEVYGLHKVRDTAVKAPNEKVQITLGHRNTQRGEIDICIDFRFDGELPKSLIEALRATALAIASLINLELSDYLVPAAPFHIRKILPDGGGQLTTGMLLAVHDRTTLEKEVIGPTLSSIAEVLIKSPYGEKLRVALDLYAAHFTELQARVRFLLLVIAMESLATPSAKHRVVIDLLASWRVELQQEMSKHEVTSEAYKGLEALFRELCFRGDDSIRSQIRKLFVDFPDLADAEIEELQRRALRVYDARSSLVHNGHLADENLSSLEDEARELLEKLFANAIEQCKKSR